MDIDEYMEQCRLEEEKEYQIFLNKFKEKTDNLETTYHAYLLLICQRYNLTYEYGIPNVAHKLLDYYIENVDEDFDTWLHKNDAPFVRTSEEVQKIFHEIPSKSLVNLVNTVNSLYGLDLVISDEYFETYVYSYSFDFNSFTPINVDEIREIKNEISVLEKHGYDTSALETKLQTYGLSEDQLNNISGD